MRVETLILLILLSLARLSCAQSIDELEARLREGNVVKALQVLDALRQTAPPNSMNQRLDALDTIISIRSADLRFNAHADAFEAEGRRADYNAAQATYDFLTDRLNALPEYPVSAEFESYMDERFIALRQRMDAIRGRRRDQIAKVQAAPKEPVPPPLPEDFFLPAQPVPPLRAPTCEQRNNGRLLQLERQTIAGLHKLKQLNDQLKDQAEIEAVSGVANLQMRRMIGEQIVLQRKWLKEVFGQYRLAGGKASAPESIATVSEDPCRTLSR